MRIVFAWQVMDKYVYMSQLFCLKLKLQSSLALQQDLQPVKLVYGINSFDRKLRCGRDV